MEPPPAPIVVVCSIEMPTIHLSMIGRNSYDRIELSTTMPTSKLVPPTSEAITLR
jgi:hypothetical protein